MDGVDVTSDVISSEWSFSIIGFESMAKLTLIDSNGAYAEKYVGGEVVQLKLAFGTPVVKWAGTLERPKKKFSSAYTVELLASHYQADLLSITVTEEYTGNKTTDTIFKELVDEYLTGYTYTSVNASTVSPTLRFDNKPFWDCILDLCDLSTFDSYLDSSKNFSFFARSSIENTTDAIVWADNLLEIEDLGIDTIDVKNRIIVYGEDDTGLPIIYQTDDTASQTTYGVKEKVIKDTSIKTYEQAKELGDAELAAQKDTSVKGEVRSLILPDLNPGDLVWVTNPPQKVQGQYRLVKYTHFLPIEQTKCIFTKEKTIPQIFKDRKKTELQLQKITNPYKATNSFNFNFDDLNQIDQTISSSIIVSEGNLKVESGSTGTMVSNARGSSSNITFVHLKVVGDKIATVTYYISTDNGDNYTEVSLETKIFVTAGTQLRVKVILNDTETRLDSLAVLYK